MTRDDARQAMVREQISRDCARILELLAARPLPRYVDADTGEVREVAPRRYCVNTLRMVQRSNPSWWDR